MAQSCPITVAFRGCFQLVDQATRLHDRQVFRRGDVESFAQQRRQVNLLPRTDRFDRPHLAGGSAAQTITGAAMSTIAGGRAAVRVPVAIGGRFRALALLPGQLIAHCLATGDKRIADVAMKTLQIILKQTVL